MPAKKVSVSITLAPAAAKGARATLELLEKAGLSESTLLAAIGVVTGTIAEGKIQALSKVPGVTVEVDDTVTIPPPDEPLQ